VAAVDAGTNGGPAWTRPAAPPGVGSAGYGGADDATQGTWMGVGGRYGAEGYRLAGAGGPAALPPWAALTTAGAAEPGFLVGGTDPRLLQIPGSADRGRGVWHTNTQFDLDLDLTDGQPHRVGLYALDHDGFGGGRSQRVQVIDRDTGAVLDTRDLAGFTGGRWLTWDVAGRVRFRVTNLNPSSNALINALVIDPGSQVTRTAYDAAGRAWRTVSPRGIESRVSFDALGRVTRTVEHYRDGVPSDTDDRTTEYSYGPAGPTALTLRLTGGGSQTTQWVYGVSEAAGSGLDSNDVAAVTRWPDPATGAATAAEQDAVTVNALGQVAASTDRTGTTHTLAYDALGRPVADAVTLLGANVDGAVRRIETAYDGQGNAALVTSYNAATGGGVVNQVKREFNGLGQLASEWQAAAGAVTGGSPRVQYAYSLMGGGANHSRPTALTYPDGRQVGYAYGAAGGLDDRLSRLAALTDGATTLEDYSYLGLGTVARRGRPQTGTELTHVRRAGEGLADGGDPYVGLDRFGRVTGQRWVTAATGAGVDWTGYAYDPDGNRLSKVNWLAAGQHQFYAYDGLGQLVRALRGSASRDWDYDAAGNWEATADNGTVTQTRGHNRQNEVTGVSGATAPVFDPAGNMTGDQTGKTLVYDAWNRLAAVKSGATVLAAYAYDGLGRRITETSGGSTTTLLYSAGWQVLEERIGGVAKTQYVWSPVYVDALVLRDRDADGNSGTGAGGREERLYALQDANWNITALVSTSGTVVERYAYDPFGAATVLNPDFSAKAGGQSGYAWTILFQGLRQSPVTALYHARNRDYSATLGRWVSTDPIGFAAGDQNLYRFVGNGPVDGIDPSGLQQRQDNDKQHFRDLERQRQAEADRRTRKKNEDAFREAARRNGVPDNVIDTIIDTANKLPSRSPGWRERHNLCEQWTDKYYDALKQKSIENHQQSIIDASKGGITSVRRREYLVPGLSGPLSLLSPDQDHTVIRIKLKDGTEFNVDVGILANDGNDDFTGKLGRITPVNRVPGDWKQSR
jgi:RHS repeat-associated protein